MAGEKTMLGVDVNVAAPNARELFGDLLRWVEQLKQAANVQINIGVPGNVGAGTGAGGAAQAVRNSTQAGSPGGSGWSPAGMYTGAPAAMNNSQRAYDAAKGVGFQGSYNEWKQAEFEQGQGRRQSAAERENERRQQQADWAHDNGIKRQQADEAWLLRDRDRGLKQMDADYAWLDKQDAVAAKARVPFSDGLGNRMRQGFNVLNPMAANNDLYTRGQQRYAAQAVVGLATHTIGGELSLYANNTATGDYNPMQAAGLAGAAAGGFLGLAAGAIIGSVAPVPQPGLGALIGMQGGMTTGSAYAQSVMAPFMRTHSMALTLSSIAAREGRNVYDMIGGHHHRIDTQTSGLQHLSEEISFHGKTDREILGIKAGLYTGTDIISGPQLAQTYATLGSGLLAAGNDPRRAYDLSANLARKYGQAAPQMATMAAGVIAQTAKWGDNRGDLMLATGPEAFGAYADATGKPDFTKEQLQGYGDVQRADYQMQVAETNPRGRGQAKQIVYDAKLKALTPFGTDTLAYRQAQQGRRQAVLQGYEERDITAYDIPMAGLEAEERIHQALPYQPGYNYGAALERMGLRANQLNTVGKRYQSLMAKGQLSEEEQKATYSQYQGMRVAQAQDVAVLAEGGEDRAMLLAAGRGNSHNRYDSEQQASMAVFNIGHPRRSHGAINGQQLAMQNAFLHKYDTPDFDAAGAAMPKDRMTGMDSTQVVGLLSRIAEAVESRGKGMGSSVNPGEARGMVTGALALTDILGMPPKNTN